MSPLGDKTADRRGKTGNARSGDESAHQGVQVRRKTCWARRKDSQPVAHALRVALVIERCGNGTVLDRVVVHPPIDLGGRNACADMRGNVVEHAFVHLGATLDALDVGRRFQQIARKHLDPLVGEGGMLFLDDEAAFRRAWAYKDHGKSWELMNAPHSGSGFRFVHENFGTNWRMTEMQAAIGRIQLEKLDT